MIPTIIGLFTVLLGALLTLQRKPIMLLCAVMAFGLLEGSAAVILTSLGGSSIPPGRIMLGFLALACCMLVKGDAPLLRRAVLDNGWLVLFCLYGLVSAMLLPRIFEAQINVVPLRPTGLRHLFDTFPLYFSNQNITTAVYLLGTGLAALCSYVAVSRTDNLNPIVTTAVAVATTHSVLGLMGVALRGTPWDQVVEFFRNGSYAQLNQETESFIRINGLMPEPSSFATVGLTWFVLCFELWLRHIRPVATGAAAALTAMVLVMSTSSTAYVGLAGYALVLGMRAVLMPPYLRAGKWLAICGAGLGMVIGIGLIVIVFSQVAQAFETMLLQMTVEKADSLSGQQRAFWAKQGIDAFFASYGLGIGAGSFRSSSIVMAILGGMGVIGIVTFAGHVLRTLLPQRPVEGMDPFVSNLADAAGWTAAICLLPAAIISASPDPGVDFACLSGIAIALKSRAMAMTRPFAPIRKGPIVSTAPEPAGWRHVSR